MNKVKLVVILFVLPLLAMAQSARNLLIEGDFFMGMDNYEEAEKNYAAASAKKASYKSYYNTAVSQEIQISSSGETAGQSMQEPEEHPLLKKAILSYATAVGMAEDPVDKSRAYYNMGNTHKADKQTITVEKLDSAIEAYKKAIKNDPQNYRARHNLAITQLQLDQMKEQEQQEQQQQQQSENEDQEEQERNQDQQQEQSEQEQEQQSEQQQQEQNEQAKQQEEKEKKEISKAEMAKILEMVEKEDQEVQQKMRAKAQSSSTEKKKKW